MNKKTFIALLFVTPLLAVMLYAAQLKINFGNAENDFNGDSLRTFASKTQTNFVELYSYVGVGGTNAGKVFNTNQFSTTSSTNISIMDGVKITNGVFFGTFSGVGNPTTSIGLTAVNGTATTTLRSDGAPALSQAIAPTWSGTHTFSLAPMFSAETSGSVLFAGANGLLSQDNANLFWDNTNKRLGLGTPYPVANVELYSATNPTILRIGSVALAENIDTGALDFSSANVAAPVYGRIAMGFYAAGGGTESGYLAFKTINNGTLSERLRITNVGLQVVGLPVYANNAAAIAGGLTAGTFYRTGADPDPVCVVH